MSDKWQFLDVLSYGEWSIYKHLEFIPSYNSSVGNQSEIQKTMNPCFFQVFSTTSRQENNYHPADKPTSNKFCG